MNYLTTQNEYRSPPVHPNWFARRFPSLSFYLPMIRRIWWGARQAGKGQLTREKRVWGALDLLRLLEGVGVRFQIENLDAFRRLNEPCVFVSNHMSTLETFILTPVIEPYREITYVVKESLVRYPVFKHIMINQQPIVVTRRNPKEDLRTVFEQGQDRLSRLISVVVFPQTTRSTSFDPAEFNSIGVKLAARAGVPVIPVALKTDAWGNNRHFVKEFGPIDPSKTVHICFGEPIHIEGNGKAQQERIIRFIAGRLEQWKY